jgi:hypothetical protein
MGCLASLEIDSTLTLLSSQVRLVFYLRSLSADFILTEVNSMLLDVICLYQHRINVHIP